MPPDGSCLYHAVNHGLLLSLKRDAPGAAALRESFASWARQNATRKVADKTLRTWLHWEIQGRMSLERYAERQATCGWGGVIELIAAAFQYEMVVAVWVPLKGQQFQRTAVFQSDGKNDITINVVRVGGVHYDFLQLEDDGDKPAAVITMHV